MPFEHVVAVAALIFFCGCGLLLVVSVIRGRRVCGALALRHPDVYDEAGRPWPGFWDSPRRSAYFQYVQRRGYATLNDPPLVDAFTRLRRFEMFELGVLVTGFAVLGAIAVWLKIFPTAPTA